MYASWNHSFLIGCMLMTAVSYKKSKNFGFSVTFCAMPLIVEMNADIIFLYSSTEHY